MRALITCLACVAATPALAQTATLGVRIVDADSRHPLADVAIGVDGVATAFRTASDGAWRVALPGRAPRTVVVRRVGYREASVVLTPGVDTAAVVALVAVPHALDATVVTAARRAQRLADVVVTTELVDRQAIAESGASDVASVLTERTGIQFTGGHPSGSGVGLQGLGDQRVLVLVDGVPLYGRISGGLDLTRLPTSAVERVEVVKGPQSTLYGSEAMGGVVNVITRGASSGGSAVELRAVGGSNRRADTDLFATTQSGAFGVTADLGHRYVERTPGVAGTSGALVDRVDGLATVRYTPASAWSIDASALVLDERQRWMAGTLYDFADNTQRNARLGTAWTGDGRRVSAGVALSRFDHLARTSQFDRPIRGTGDRQVQRLAQADLLFTQQLARTTVDVGAQLRDERITSSDGRIAGGSRSSTSAEPYAQLEIGHDRWSVVPGARLSWNEQWGAYASPRIAARFRADPSLTLRASAGRGFRAPDFKELYLDFTNDAAFYGVRGNRELRPEHSTNVSAGAEWDRGRAYVRAQGYANTLRDFIETRPLPSSGGFTQYTYANVARGTTRGVEIESAVRLPLARIEGGYAYLHARDRTTGGPLLGQPAHSGRLALGTMLPRAIRATATVVRTGATPMQRDDTGQVTGTRDAYTRLDLRLAMPVVSRVELSLGVDNLLADRPALWADATGRQVHVGATWRLRGAID